MGEPLRIGVVGIGQISGAYLTMLGRLPQLRVTRLADLDAARAETAAQNVPGASAVPVGQLMASPDVDLVLNLTVPAAHAEIALAALTAGKHVYGEKPLALDMVEAEDLLAHTSRLRLGCAPDTVLGTGTQTARRIVADGLIGTPVAANAAFTTAGHERWHPSPEFYYRPGAGPLFDMGPYYLSALVHMLGPVRRVTGAASCSRSQRVIESGPRAGKRFNVEVETHVTGTLEHASGALTTLTTSFDVVASTQPHIEIHGTEGSIIATDPNVFRGDVMIRRRGDHVWSVVPASAGYQDAGRGAGVADLAENLAVGRPHRASAELALHVLDIMQTLLIAAREQAAQRVATSCPVPDLVPLGSLGA